MKAITLVWLTRADLSNLNSGQGSGNLTELKTYANGTKPYISGQATRTALFDTIARSHPDNFHCTSERPCTDVQNCWNCDLRGFLATKEGEGGERRWSPIKVTPGLGQLPREIVTDLLTRSSVIEKDDRSSKDMRLANVQMTDNLYRFAMVIDVENIGLVKEPILEGKGKEQRVTGWNVAVDIGENERKIRLAALLDGVFNLSGFAKQARAAASLAPDILLAISQETYNQRGLKALEVDDDGNIKIEILDNALLENKDLGHQVMFGGRPGIVNNWDEVIEVLGKYGIDLLPVHKVIERLKSTL
ncbi:MAG: DevR family CRISPR-associated autoregulator [Bacillota bacterium]|jgi:CRISPR-associated protein Cst2